MNAVLLRSEPFLRLAPLAALLAGVFASMLVFPDAPGFDRERAANPTTLYRVLSLAAFVALMGFATFVPAGRRLQAFERTLPIPARSVVATRAFATAIGLALPFAVALIALALRGQPDASGQPLVLVALSLPFVITATVLFGFTVFPSHAALEGARLFAALAGMAILLLLPTAYFAPWIAPAYAVLALCLLGLLKSPASYLYPTRHPSSVSASPTKGFGVPFGLDPLHWTLLRSTVLRPQTLGPLLALLWIVPSVRQMHTFFFWIIAYFVFSVARVGLCVLRGLGSLPIPRERVLRYASLTPLLCLVGAFGARAFVTLDYPPFTGLHTGVELDRTFERTLDGRDEYGPQLLVPPRLWKLSATDEPFVVQAPWGETHTPTPHPLFFGASLAAVNPYSVSSESTVQFISWQISRALAETGGPSMDADGVRERFFAQYDPTSPVDELGWEFNRGVIHAGNPAGIQALGGLALLAILTWALGCAWALSPNLPGIGVRTWRRRRWGRLILPAASFALLYALTFIIDDKDGVVLPVLLASFLSQIDTLVGGSLVGWILLDLALAALVYLAFMRRVLRIDPPVPRNGWTGRPFSVF